MKIHLRQIPAEGLHLQGEEECPFQDIETDELRCAGRLRYELEVGVSEGSLWANGTLEQPVELRCVSCLENFRSTVKVPAFALHSELRGPETVDITPQMREDLLLNLPPHPHCDREGGRKCPGAKAQEATGRAEKQAAAKREHDWGELDKLKLKKR